MKPAAILGIIALVVIIIVIGVWVAVCYSTIMYAIENKDVGDE